MIAGADLARLRDRAPTPSSPVLSVYLEVDQSRAANLRGEFVTALKARLRAIEQRLGEAQREAFRADADRVLRFVADHEPRAKTLVAFADDSAGFFWSGELRASLPTDARWEPKPYLRPLLEVVDEHEPYAVVLVDKQRARLFTVFLGEVEEEREAIAAADVRHKKASGTDHWRSHMRFQRQDDMHVQSHLRQVAHLLEEVARGTVFHRLVLAGPVEATSELARVLSRPLAARVVGTLRLAVDAPAAEVLRQTLEVAARAERDAEQALVAQLLDAGALGLETVLIALQERRVLVLAYADGFAASGAECPRCRGLFVSADGPACAYCGERLVAVGDVLERALERAEESGARAEPVRGEAAARLRAAGGIGAALRF
jgi:peptide subunit release factor 1 (eRF1)